MAVRGERSDGEDPVSDRERLLVMARKADQISPVLTARDSLDPLDPLSSGHFYVLFADGNVIGWSCSLTASDALRRSFYDWEDSRYKALQTGICRKSQIEEAIECGEIKKRLRFRDPEIERLKKENIELRRQIKELRSRGEKKRKRS
jgi:hypothetical protein